MFADFLHGSAAEVEAGGGHSPACDLLQDGVIHGQGRCDGSRYREDAIEYG